MLLWKRKKKETNPLESTRLSQKIEEKRMILWLWDLIQVLIQFLPWFEWSHVLSEFNFSLPQFPISKAVIKHFLSHFLLKKVFPSQNPSRICAHKGSLSLIWLLKIGDIPIEAQRSLSTGALTSIPTLSLLYMETKCWIQKNMGAEIPNCNTVQCLKGCIKPRSRWIIRSLLN